MTMYTVAAIVYLVVTLFLIGVFLDELEGAALPVALFWPLTVWIALGAWVAYKFDGRAW